MGSGHMEIPSPVNRQTDMTSAISFLGGNKINVKICITAQKRFSFGIIRNFATLLVEDDQTEVT